MNITDLYGTVQLSNGVEMPYMGLGTYKVDEGYELIEAIRTALKIGYRHIDTASLYANERGIGEAIALSGTPRNEIFITTKVWNSDQGYDSTLRAFHTSLEKLNSSYIDLYLVHWPVRGKFTETWRALETLYNEGKVRAIGISNFLQHQIEDLMQHAKIAPMVNQMEFHPYLVQQSLVDFCRSHNIQYEAWSPFMQGKILGAAELQKIAQRYNKDVAQVILRWNLQKGVVTIPKSIKTERILSNSQIFDFVLNEVDMKLIDAMDRNQRIGAHPDTFDF